MASITKRFRRPSRGNYQVLESGDGIPNPSASLTQRIAFPLAQAPVTLSPSSSNHSLEGPSAGRRGPPRMTSSKSVNVLNRGMSKTKSAYRTSKTSHKLALFPDEAEEQPGQVLSSFYGGDDVYNQLNQLTNEDRTSHLIDAERWRKLRRDTLPRVTAYCTATSYDLKAVFRYLQSRKESRQSAPKLMDECLYSPFTFKQRSIPIGNPTSTRNAECDNLVDLSPSTTPREGLKLSTSVTYDTMSPEMAARKDSGTDNQSDYFDLIKDHLTSEVFVFDYGVIVFWAMTQEEEKQTLRELRRFEVESLDAIDIEIEEFNLYYNPNFPPMIYNDVIRLRHPRNYMVKMAISHAIAQSVKLTLYEDLVEDTINDTKHIPQLMAKSGRVKMSRSAIIKKIGQLFIMRINVNLVSNILDTPEIFWSEPSLQPLYDAIRGYLEISQRAEIMNHRVSVISDLLDMLREHLNGNHGEFLEWIVIILICIEVAIGLVTIYFESQNLSHNTARTSIMG
ncbi:sporulation protein rmd1 [Dimargaris cristalligena]|nr:sporulation protein rmd1 [Dimargaris cristalligena]